MSILNLQIGYNWEVRTPTVDRLMHREFVDSFFQTGALRLSSFESFCKHPDEARRDTEEGKAAMKITSPRSNLSAIAFNGQEAYVLCGSMTESQITDGHLAIRVKDTFSFVATVARQIPGFIGGAEGPCIYRSNTFYEATDEHVFAPPEDGEDPERWMQKQNAVVGNHMKNKFFIKHSRFSSEAEYRMIWFCGSRDRSLTFSAHKQCSSASAWAPNNSFKPMPLRGTA